MEKSIDYKLIENKDYKGLWSKYRALYMTYFQKLPEDIRNIVFDNSFEIFYLDYYEVVVNAAASVNLSKISKPETWTFWQQLSFYLHNYTTRNIVRDTYKLWNSEKQELDFNSDEHNKYKASEDHHEYNMLMESFTDDELQVVTQRLSGVSWAVIYKQIGSRKKGEELRSKIEEKILNYI